MNKLKHIKVVPVAFDSMGVRSMATYVETPDVKIFIDPGVALGPKRYGLPPSKEELEALNFFRQRIMDIASKADVIIVTHYHYDHHPFPEDLEMYERVFKDKIVLAKDISKDINASGKKRGKIFEERVKGLAKELVWADSKSFRFGDTEILIPKAVWHGDVGSRVGKVIMPFIRYKNESFLFGSDAQALADPEARKIVLSLKPQFLIVDGYPTIFVGWRMKKSNFEEAKAGLKHVFEVVNPSNIIFDHHGVRDINFREKMENFWGFDVKTAAEHLGIGNMFLEAWRKELHKGERQVDLEDYFEKWKKATKL